MAFTSSKKKKITKTRHNKQPIFPPAFHAFFAKRLTDIVGGLFVMTGLCLAFALFSHSATDPSLNTAGQASAVHNFLGRPGAHISDLFLQTLGISAYLISACFIVWGARVLMRKPLRPMLPKISFLLIAVLAGSIASARIPAFESWIMGSYLGGSAGILLFNSFTDLMAQLIGISAHYVIAGIAAVISVVCFAIALGFGKSGWQFCAQNFYSLCYAAYYYCRLGLHKIFNWHEEYSQLDLKRPTIPALPKPITKSSVEKTTTLMPDAAQNLTEPTQKKKAIIASHPVPVEKSSLNPAKQQAKLALTTSDLDWSLPPINFLEEAPAQVAQGRPDNDALQKNAEILHSTLEDFKIQGDILKVNPGPVVTLYEFEPAPGTKSSRVIGLADDIARSMSSVSARVAVIPGKNAMGIELPNVKREIVYLRDLFESRVYDKNTNKLPLVLGKDIGGAPVIADLARMPHLLVAGTTGSGKSVAINTMILSLLYRFSPEKCRFIMIDPKMLELSVYDDIPHLLTPVVTEPHKAVTALKWAVREMEDRYRLMSKLGVRNLEGYNSRVKEALSKGEVVTHRTQTGFDPETGKPTFEEQPLDLTELPFIVVIVDEFADLMLVAGKEVEMAIQRLAQMARAAGIHLIMATQRPSVDVITGVIKANFPTRISFQVTSKFDSRTILGEGGAEQLLGRGDMLYMAAGGRIQRVHGPFVDDAEVEQVVSYLKSQGEPEYVDNVTDGEDEMFGDDGIKGIAAGNDGYDELYDQAVALVLRERKASTSFVQRHMQIGYNRAARIIETMEKEGIIGAANHVGKREILFESIE